MAKLSTLEVKRVYHILAALLVYCDHSAYLNL